MENKNVKIIACTNKEMKATDFDKVAKQFADWCGDTDKANDYFTKSRGQGQQQVKKDEQITIDSVRFAKNNDGTMHWIDVVFTKTNGRKVTIGLTSLIGKSVYGSTDAKSKGCWAKVAGMTVADALKVVLENKGAKLKCTASENVEQHYRWQNGEWVENDKPSTTWVYSFE